MSAHNLVPEDFNFTNKLARMKILANLCVVYLEWWTSAQ